MSSHTRPHLSLILNTPPQAQVGSVSDGIRGPLLLASIRIDTAESVFQLVLCVVAKSVLQLASFLRGFSSRLVARLLFAAPLCGSSRLCGVVLHGFVASSRFFADFLSVVRPIRPITVRPILPLKPVVKAWSLGLLFGRYLHREGILMGHIVVVGVPSDLGLHL